LGASGAGNTLTVGGNVSMLTSNPANFSEASIYADGGATVDIDRFLKLDAERRRTIVQVETLKNQRNVASQEIAQLKKNKQDASSQIEAMKRVGDDIKALDERLAGIEEELRNLELDFPNVPHQSVPVGSDESANRVERTWGEKPKFAYTPKPHWDIGEALGVRFRVSLKKRVAGAEAVGAHKTSMLQDIETGRVIEADALIGSVIELGRIVRVATPHMDAIYAAVKLLGETLTHAKGRLVMTRA